MRSLLIAVVSAIFFAAVIVELSTRLWPQSHLALLLITCVGLFINGLFNAKLVAGAAAPAASRDKSAAPRSRGGERPRSRDRSEPRRETRTVARGESTAQPGDGPREDGEVKWFNRNKGFGFIIRNSGEEIFVHQRSIRLVGEGENRRRPSLRDGQAVSFQIAERDKGIQAEDVIAID